MNSGSMPRFAAGDGALDRGARTVWGMTLMTKLIDTAESTAGHTAERRMWEAPRLTTVVPVDRTKGGTGLHSFESASY